MKVIHEENIVAVPDTGWRCAVCFEHAQVQMIDVTLCVPHAKRYKFGYGEQLKSMGEEDKQPNKLPEKLEQTNWTEQRWLVNKINQIIEYLEEIR